MKLLFVVLTFCSYVNLFSGTDGNGHCHPCACTPFGAVQAGPQTGNWGWDYCGGYQWRDTTVMGFSHNRIDGTGSSELGDLLMMPFTGEALREDYSSRFDKAGEIAVPGYYCCTLTDFGIKAEISCTPHVALHRYTSDESPIRLMLDLQSAQTGSKDRMYKRVLDCSQDYSDSLHVRGYTHSKAWNDRVIFFDIEFSRPYTVAAVLDKRDRREMIERTVLDFGGATDTLMVKTSISIKSVAGAGSNIAAELPGWDFEAVREEAGRMWEERLGRVEIKGTETQKRIFYTAMYHLMMHPNDIADCGDAPLYSTLSLWDTFRAAHPIYTILAPDIVDGVIGSFKYYYDRQGFLPMWVAGGTDNHGMIGNHSIPVIVDAYLKGFRGFDADTLYAAMKRTLTEDHIKCEWGPYDSCGYFPSDIMVESASRTLECCYDDACMALFAKELGHDSDAEFFSRRAGYWRNLMDPGLHLIRPRDSSGAWMDPFDPLRVEHWKTGGAFTEANSWQYTWHVLHDPEGLMEMMGGRGAFVTKLDSLFSMDEHIVSAGVSVDVSGMTGQYAHGNEPSHHVIYLYSIAGEPDKAADLIHGTWTGKYQDSPDGLSGNDDCGQMSAWYIFSALGFYPVNPCGGEYVIGAPQLPRMTVHLPGGRDFTVIARGAGHGKHRVASVRLNGRRMEGCTIGHEDLMKGGKLKFRMR